MTVATVALGADTVAFIETMVPFKGTISTAVGFYGLSRMPSAYFSIYQGLLDAAVIVYAVLEMTQVCHLCFIASRFMKERIDFDQGLL
mmetsp:Transcript_10815/g.14556  ORF Transcript_10815/g.14556 Transcript_10815/m.14556 type:complete len:88 (-) Transcript_10815:802-1065(-)